MISFHSTKHNISGELIVVTAGDDNGVAYHFLPNGIETTGEFFFNRKSENLFIELPSGFSAAGDILSVHPNGVVRKLVSSISADNILFVTGQCNNHCLMCSQPPVKRDDTDYYDRLNRFIVDHLPPETVSLGITGGEPTLIGERLPELIAHIFQLHPELSLHMLTNGRRFADKSYARRFVDFSAKALMIGIPFHSDYVHDHDHIAGADGAFDHTLSGLYNLALYDLKIEIRIVVNLQNYRRLSHIAGYIFRNIPFARHVAFMGLEDIGLAIRNRQQVWIDPVDYAPYLEEAVVGLAQWGVNVSVYNIPLCLLPESLYEFSRRSITDWKETYTQECAECNLRTQCCGLFATSKTQSKFIHPILSNYI